jgi:hypothetical protein
VAARLPVERLAEAPVEQVRLPIQQLVYKAPPLGLAQIERLLAVDAL